MNGSIAKRGKNSWRLTISVGKDEHGKRKRRFVTVNGTKAEAQRHLRELLTSVDKGLSIDTSKTILSKFLDQWLRDYVETNTAPKTQEDYSAIIHRYINPSLGHIQLNKLTPQHVQTLYSSLLGKGLSARTVQYTHRVLSQALSHAVKWELLLRNVCDAIDAPRPRKKEMKALDATSVQMLLNATSQSRYGAVYYLALYTGLRRGEVLGLRWCDVDLSKNALSVNQTVVRITGKGLIISEPKTSHSRRLVSLSPNAVALLAGLKAKRKEEFNDAGLYWEEAGLVFCNPDGDPLSPSTISHSFSRIAKSIGLPPIRFHDLRHTHATIMLKEGIHPKIVSERLGHASINITLDTYSHVLPGMQETAALAFEEALQATPREAAPTTI
ncbi:MAG: site-specific integrase [Planctomycetes bacterium]|nr:site-specific integrase [Planctomycetota bacterium]